MGEIISWERAHDSGNIEFVLVYAAGERVTFRKDGSGESLEGVIQRIDKMLRNGKEYDLIIVAVDGVNYAITKHDLIRTVNVETL